MAEKRISLFEILSSPWRTSGYRLWRLGLLVALAGCQPVPILPDDDSGNHRIVGVWYWQLPTTGCVEVYRYYEDGTYAVISGKEIATGTYVLSGSPNMAGRYELRRVTGSDNRGLDCGGSSADSSGKESVVYVEFNSIGNAMVKMYDPAADRGFGPLYRLSQ